MNMTCVFYLTLESFQGLPITRPPSQSLALLAPHMGVTASSPSEGLGGNSVLSTEASSPFG